MKFIDKKERVMDLKLTSYGHYLFSIGKFKPEYYAFYDDNVLYARGYSNDNQNEELFQPLDTWGSSYGCTDIKYRNLTTNKMESC